MDRVILGELSSSRTLKELYLALPQVLRNAASSSSDEILSGISELLNDPVTLHVEIGELPKTICK